MDFNKIQCELGSSDSIESGGHALMNMVMNHQVIKVGNVLPVE
jgi:hypothetical protein